MITRHDPEQRRRRATTLAVVVALHAAALVALLQAHAAGSLPPEFIQRLVVFDVVVPLPREKQPPPTAKRQKVRASSPRRPEGAATAPERMAQAAPIAAVVPRIPLPTILPVVTAQTPDAGAEQSQGAASEPGTGQGAGGTGSGTGSGAAGDGSGGGGNGGDGAGHGTPPRQIAGNITPRDYPRALRDSMVPVETISLQFTIGTDGRVHECRILKSSGSDLLDQHTCRLYETRYRYEPARDLAGRPERVTVRATRTWFIVDRG